MRGHALDLGRRARGLVQAPAAAPGLHEGRPGRRARGLVQAPADSPGNPKLGPVCYWSHAQDMKFLLSVQTP